MKALSGELAGWRRLRTGNYRSILQLRIIANDETIYVDYIGHGDAY